MIHNITLLLQGKTTLFLLCCQILFMPLVVYSTETPKSISFFELESMLDSSQKAEIQIRGFLYKTLNGQLILAAEPDLKSCCVGNASKRNRQLLVFGNIDPMNLQSSAVLLKGELNIDPRRQFPAHLERAIAIEEESNKFLLFAVAAVLSAIGMAFFLGRKR